jgi:hypothetical protein
MSTVTRLEWEACDVHNCHCDIVESKDGDMVNYDDYVALEKKLTDMAVQLANAESKCSELAAENAGLKAICEDRRTFIMNGVQLGYIKVPTVDTDPALDTIRVAVSPQAPTPATDAFLAEVRVQGVDLVCDYHKSRCEALHDVDRNGSHRHGAALCDAIDIAAKISEGVKS